MAGGKLKARPEGYHREVSHLQRLHDKLRLDTTRDPQTRAKICRSLSEAICELNSMMDREMLGLKNGEQSRAKNGVRG